LNVQTTINYQTIASPLPLPCVSLGLRAQQGSIRQHDHIHPPVAAAALLPLFATQLLGAFNDNLYKNAAVFFVVYGVFNSEKSEAIFSAVASALFIVPFFVLSALAGQLADMRDKAQIIRWVKLAEILIMLAGGAGLVIWQAKHGILAPWESIR
jgi:arginine exporter protein ArgO